MSGSFRRLSLLFLGSILVLGAVSASSKNRAPAEKKVEQIVIIVQKAANGLLFEVESAEYKRSDANALLAELKLHKGGDCQIIALIDDRAPLSAVTDLSEMVINAGFKEIHPFVLWHKTGRMGEIQFGPATKFTKDPVKIKLGQDGN
jgi:hypothetical protein